MRNTIRIFLLLSLFVCCQSKSAYTPIGLRKITDDELLHRYKNHDFPDYLDVKSKDKFGREVSQDSLKILSENGGIYSDLYIDKNGQILERIIRKTTIKDRLLIKKIMKDVEEGPDLTIVTTDCKKKAMILLEVYNLDQDMRNENLKPNRKMDFQYLEIVLSLIDQYGMPTLKEVGQKQMNAIWFVFQHANKRYRKEYFPLPEIAAKNEDLDMT